MDSRHSLLGGVLGVVACLFLASPPCPTGEVGHYPTRTHKRCSP